MENEKLSPIELGELIKFKKDARKKVESGIASLEEEKAQLQTEKSNEQVDAVKKEIYRYFKVGAAAIANREGMVFGELEKPEARKKTPDSSGARYDHQRAPVIEKLGEEINIVLPEFDQMKKEQQALVLDLIPNRLYNHIEDTARKRFSQRLDAQSSINRAMSKLWKNRIIAAHEKQVYAELGGEVQDPQVTVEKNREKYKEAHKAYKEIPKAYKKEYERAVKSFNQTGQLEHNERIDAYIEAEKNLAEAEAKNPSFWKRLTSKIPEPFSSIWKRTDASLTDAEVTLNRENFLKDSMEDVVVFVKAANMKAIEVGGEYPLIDYLDTKSFDHITDTKNRKVLEAITSFNNMASEYAATALYEHQTTDATKTQQEQQQKITELYEANTVELEKSLEQYARDNHIHEPKLFAKNKIDATKAIIEATRLLSRTHDARGKITALETSTIADIAPSLKLPTLFTEQNRLSRAGKIQRGAQSVIGMGSIENQTKRLETYLKKLEETKENQHTAEQEVKHRQHEIEAEKKALTTLTKETEKEITAIKKLLQEIPQLPESDATKQRMTDRQEQLLRDKELNLKMAKVDLEETKKKIQHAAKNFNEANREHMQTISELAVRVEFMQKKYQGGQLAVGVDPLEQALYFLLLQKATQAIAAENEHQEHLQHDAAFVHVYETPEINSKEFYTNEDREKVKGRVVYPFLPKSDVYTEAENLDTNRRVPIQHNVRNLLSLDNNKYIIDEQLNDILERDANTAEKITTRNVGIGESNQARIANGIQKGAVNEGHRSVLKKLSPEMIARIEERSKKEAEVTVEKYLQGGVSSPEWTLFLKDIPAKDFLSGTMEPDLQPLYKPLYTYLNTLSAKYKEEYRGMDDTEVAKEHMSTYDYIRYLFAKKDIIEQDY